MPQGPRGPRVLVSISSAGRFRDRKTLAADYTDDADGKAADMFFLAIPIRVIRGQFPQRLYRVFAAGVCRCCVLQRGARHFGRIQNSVLIMSPYSSVAALKP